jgi:hypothetical protein
MSVRRFIRKRKKVRIIRYRKAGTPSHDQHSPPSYEPGIQTPRLLQDASQVKPINKPPIEAKRVYHKPSMDYISLAIEVAKAYYRKISRDHVNKAAECLFRFHATSHMDKKMPDLVAQEIYDWILTLSEQHINEEEKLRLAKEFIVGLTPVGSSVSKYLLRHFN